MATNKLVGLLGMCRASGRLTAGFDAVAALCRESSVLLMVADDAAERTVRQLTFAAGDIPVYRIPLTRDEVANAIGSHKPVAVLATTDIGFMRALRPLLTIVQEEES